MSSAVAEHSMGFLIYPLVLLLMQLLDSNISQALQTPQTFPLHSCQFFPSFSLPSSAFCIEDGLSLSKLLVNYLTCRSTKQEHRGQEQCKVAYLCTVLRHPQKHHCWEGFSVLGSYERIWLATCSPSQWETQTQSCIAKESGCAWGLLL